MPDRTPLKSSLSPALVVALIALGVGSFDLLWQWTRPTSTCHSAFTVASGVGVQNDDAPILFVGDGVPDGAVNRAEGGGKTIIFQNGFTVGAHHRFQVTGAKRDKTLLIYEDDSYSSIISRFEGRDVILGDAPFTGARGLGDVYIAGFACSGVFHSWEQTSVYHFADGMSVYSVVHTMIPGLRGTQLVSSSQDIDLVLASDGMIYIGDVPVSMRNANKGSCTVLVGGRVIIQEVFRNATFDCVRIAPSDSKKVPQLLVYEGTCGSFTSHTAVCVLAPGQRQDLSQVCNEQLLAGYVGFDEFTQIHADGLCDFTSPNIPIKIFKDPSDKTGEQIATITSDGGCQQDKFRWVCAPEEVLQ
jgi:hypothetical protein